MVNEIKRLLSDYEINTITKTNFESVMEIYSTNQEFFLLTEGKEVKSEDCIKDIDEIPPGIDIENKVFISIWGNGKILGVLDFLTGYPVQRCVWIGLLMIHGELHGKKIGTGIVNAVLEAAKVAGYEAVQLGVIANNLAGLSFWRKQGFEKIRETKIKRDSMKALNVVVMENRI